MARLEEKLERFEEAVMSQAQSQSQEILNELEALRKEQISKTENDALSAAYDFIQEEISGVSANAEREISQLRLKQKQEYLAQRTAYEARVFDTVRQRLLAYTGTGDYETALRETARELAGHGMGEGVTLVLKKADAPHKAAVREGYGAACEIVFSDEVTLGGILLKNNANGFVVDMTLDTRLADQRDWFYQNCKL